MGDVAPFMQYGSFGVLLAIVYWLIRYQMPQHREDILKLTTQCAVENKTTQEAHAATLAAANAANATRLEQLHGEHRADLVRIYKDNKKELNDAYGLHRSEMAERDELNRQALNRQTAAVEQLTSRVAGIEMLATGNTAIPLPAHKTGA